MDRGGNGGEKKQHQHKRARSDSAHTWVMSQNAGAGVGGGVLFLVDLLLIGDDRGAGVGLGGDRYD